MGEHKGRTVVFIRELIESLGGADVEAKLDSLGPEERTTYDAALTLSWVPDRHVAAIIRIAAQLLYPGSSGGMREIGRHQARADLGGLYRVLLTISTVPFALSRTAQFWKTYNRRGAPELTMGEDGKSAALVVRDYPEYPAELGKYNCGYILGVLEQAGAGGVIVSFELENGTTPRWSARWQ